MKKHFNKKLVMSKEDDEDFKSLSKCWICDNICLKLEFQLQKKFVLFASM